MTRPRPAKTRSARAAPPRVAAPARTAPWVAIAALLACAGYLAAFFVAVPERSRALLGLFLPDLYVTWWAGGGDLPLGLFDRAPPLLLALAIVAGAVALGAALLRCAGLRDWLRGLEFWVFATGVGLNALSLLTLAWGWAGLLGPLSLGGSLAALVAIGWRLGAAPRVAASGGATVVDAGFTVDTNALPSPAAAPRANDHAEAAPSASERAATWALAALAAPFVLLLLAGAALPPVDFDAREYHLQAPKEWRAQGRVGFVAHNVYANMPLGGEAHALLAMTLAPGERGWRLGALAGKIVLALHAVLAGLALAAAAARLAGPLAGAAAGLIFVALPLTAHVALAGLNDGAVACFVFLAAFATWLALAGPADAPRGRLALLAGFCAGGACACKYSGVLFAAAPLALVWTAWAARAARSGGGRGSRRGAPRPWAWPALFCAGALAGGGLWYVKNAVETGNPVYPLLARALGGATRDPDKIARWERAHRVPPYSLERLAADARGLTLASDGLHPALWPLAWASLAALAPMLRRRRDQSSPPVHAGQRPLASEARREHARIPSVAFWWAAAAFLAAAWWLATHRIDRFWLPLAPPAALLAGVGFAGRARAPGRVGWWCLLLAGLLFAGLWNASPRVKSDARFLVALEALWDDASLTGERTARLNPAHAWLNQRFREGGPDAPRGVLLVGDAQPFDLEMPALYNTCFDDCWFERLFAGKSRAERLAGLRARGVTHVYVHWGELARYRAPGNYGYSAYVTEARVRDELVNQQRLLTPVDWPAPAGWGALYQVADE